MHKTSLIAALAVAVLAGHGSYAQEAGDAASIVSKLVARTVKSPIAIDCEVIRESSPMKSESEERERRLGELRAQLHGTAGTGRRVDKVSVENMVQQVRQQYEQGAKSVGPITLFLAPDYSALMQPHEEAQLGTRCFNREVRKRDLRFELHDLNPTIKNRGFMSEMLMRLRSSNNTPQT
jgi:hypothetical protein